jgi:ABC-type glycerol-3-phosphate transport system substrate-binding protein
MNRLLIITLASLSLSACGGSEEDGSSAAAASALTGTWYSASLLTSWTFYSSGTGQLRTKSYDGTSCQITDIEFTVNSAGNTITYYGTRYQQLSNPANYTDYNQTVRKGPYSTSYSLSGNSIAIGNGSYTKRSAAAC